MGIGFYAVERDWRIYLFNTEAERHFGQPRQKMMGCKLWDIYPAARETSLGRQFLQAMARREVITAETPSVVVEGKWLEYRLFPLGDGLGVRFTDITDRKRAEQHRDLLLNELHHRVKNTITTVQAFVGQVLRQAAVADSVQAAIDDRLRALGSVHDLLAHEDWHRAKLSDVILRATEPYRMREQERFELSGADLWVPSRLAIALSMVLHELCTNATKYGSLSVEGGRVRLEWNVSEANLSLTWRELHGPPVTRPTRQGFGSRLIGRALASELGGGANLVFDPEGVICEIHAALADAPARLGVTLDDEG